MKEILMAKLSTLLIAAFGLAAALAWNSAIQELFKTYFIKFVGPVGTITMMFVYAIVITLVAVLVTVAIEKNIKKKEEKKKKRRRRK